MISSQIRATARESLTGKWGKAALLTLCYMIITYVISFVCNLVPVIGPIVLLVISTPISFGFIVSMMKLKRGEEVGYVDFLCSGFANFGRVWGVVGNTILKMILPVCLIIVFAIVMAFGISGSAIFGIAYESASGIAGFGIVGIIGFIGYIVSLIYAIVKGYLYSLTYYILNDNPNMTGKEIVEESEKLMMGNRWKFFWLGLTFIGWAILAGLTLGIGMFWLMPYITVSMICFYEDLIGKTPTQSAETDVEPITEE